MGDGGAERRRACAPTEELLHIAPLGRASTDATNPSRADIHAHTHGRVWGTRRRRETAPVPAPFGPIRGRARWAPAVTSTLRAADAAGDVTGIAATGIAGRAAGDGLLAGHARAACAIMAGAVTPAAQQDKTLAPPDQSVVSGEGPRVRRRAVDKARRTCARSGPGA